MRRTRRLLTEAADLLACCASQYGGWLSWSTTRDLHGAWSDEARELAALTWATVEFDAHDGIDERYAEAESRLRVEAAKISGHRKRARHV